MGAARPSASGSFWVDALGLDPSLAVAETANGAIDDADSVAEAAVLQEVLAAKRQASRDRSEECDGRRFARLAETDSLPAARLQLAVGLVGVMRV